MGCPFCLSVQTTRDENKTKQIHYLIFSFNFRSSTWCLLPPPTTTLCVRWRRLQNQGTLSTSASCIMSQAHLARNISLGSLPQHLCAYSNSITRHAYTVGLWLLSRCGTTNRDAVSSPSLDILTTFVPPASTM